MIDYNKIIVIIILVISIILLTYNYSDQLKIILLNKLVVLRGILSPNCNWFNVSDGVLQDGAGINLYNSFKKKYGDFAPSYMFGKEIYVVSNINHIKTILLNSPDLFTVGDLKKKFFKSFMANNVGVSTGCPWKRRRHMNEMALITDRLHVYAEDYNMTMKKHISAWITRTELNYIDFKNLGKIMVEKIVFNDTNIDNDVFNIFREANSVSVFYNPNFQINPKIYNNYLKTLTKYINKPKKKSLIDLCLRITNNKQEVLHQIPHFIFPIVGLFAMTFPRLLLLLINHPDDLKLLLQEIYSINGNNMITYANIYKLSFLRKCILETLRLNNPVITTFRTLTKDFTFDGGYNFKKGTQFLILNNPVLREREFYKEPNKFIPSRWTPEMEKSFYAISFNQGPQKCPGKELAIYLLQSAIYNIIKSKKIGINNTMISEKIDTDDIPQVINPCNIKIYFKPL